MNEQGEQAQVEQETYPLDDASIELLAEIEQQVTQLSASRQGILTLFARQQKLQGRWNLSPNGKELVKAQ